MSDLISFDSAMDLASKVPMSRIDRSTFLRNELQKYCTKEQIEIAIKFNPAKAGIDIDIIRPIAKVCIAEETKMATATSFVSGLPGGFAIPVAVSADGVQLFVRMLRIIQKLAYLYGWPDFYQNGRKLDSETKNLMVAFLGVMFGVRQAVNLIAKFAESLAAQVGKKIASRALTKTMWYPILKSVLSAVGVKLTKDVFGRGVSKVVPLLGGVISGALTYTTFKPMSEKLRKHLEELPLCSICYYENLNKKQSVDDFDDENYEIE